MWNSWAIRWLRPVMLSFSALTVAATLGFGEHYLIDLIVGIPFALAVQSGFFKQTRIALCGLGLTVAWMLYLRFSQAPNSPLVSWSMVLATVVACVVWAQRSARQQAELQ